MRKRLCLLLGAAVVSGCASIVQGPADVRVEPGTEIRFERPPTVDGSGHVWFQDGETGGFHEVERRGRPFCRLRTGLEPGEEVPRTWTVTEFRIEQHDTGRISPRRPFGLDSEIPIIEYRSIMRLERAGERGDDAWLRCAREHDAGWRRYVEADRLPAIIGHGVTFTAPDGG